MFDEIGALMLGAYSLIIVISFWCISSFISMECPSLSRLIIVSLKSTLSKISIATPAWFWGLLAWPFTLSQCLFLSMRWVSNKQEIVGSSFLIQFASVWILIQCLLLEELSLLTFSVNIDRYVVIPVF
jgi:hypothetical protein